ncbi:hypothetical protein HRS9139_08239 [Pyrenophora teres f. teres]|nr:hypothetical protein HRS9139_08239 [Pyrenophora teres f. teres]
MMYSQLDDGLPASPLLRLPFEVRLIIYEYLLFPSTTPSTGNGTSVANLLPDYHTYYSQDTNSDAFTLSVRTIDPWFGAQGPKTWRRRSTYHIRTGPFLTTTTPTTYRILLSPYTAHLRQTIPSLLILNRQIHAEASKVLYSTYTFSFHMSIEAIVPFLSDLTPTAAPQSGTSASPKKPCLTPKNSTAQNGKACANSSPASTMTNPPHRKQRKHAQCTSTPSPSRSSPENLMWAGTL